MRILLVGNYLPDQQESMHRFTEVLCHGLSDAGHEVRVARPSALLGALHPGPAGLGKWIGYIDRFCLFPFELRKSLDWADVVHICVNPIYTKWVASKPCVVTCHDVLPIRSALGEIPQQKVRFTGRQFQRMILAGLNRAAHVACVSDSTKCDLDRVAQRSDGNTSVVRNGLNYPYSPMAKQEFVERLASLKIPTDRRFLLHVGGNQWYKNRLGVLDMYSCTLRHESSRDMLLVMVGKPWTYTMRRFVSDRKLAGKVIQLKEVSNEDLRALYSAATALLFPSLQEGFGWPIVEAQACGCPVFTSNRPPMSEIAGRAGVLIDPEDAGSAAETIVENLPHIHRLVPVALENAARFSTSSMIKGYLELYQSLVHENSSRHTLG